MKQSVDGLCSFAAWVVLVYFVDEGLPIMQDAPLKVETSVGVGGGRLG